MANHKTSNPFLQEKRRMNFNDNSDPPESHSRESGSSYQSRLLDIKIAERTKRDALTQQAEKLYESQQAHTNAVLERLGLSVQLGTLPIPKPPATPKQKPESSLRGKRIRPILKVEEKNCSQTSRSNQTLYNDDPFFEKKLRLGSQMAILACKLEKLKVENRSPVAPMNSVDTPSQPQMCPTESPSPLHTPVTKRTSRLPVKTSGEDKKIVDGWMLQTATPKVDKIVKKLEQFQGVHRQSSQPPAVPTPPSAAVPTKKRGPRCRTNLHLANDKPQPLVNTSDRLSLCFRQLNSEDWEKKMDGLKTVQALARDHQDLLQMKLHEICLVLATEVKNLRSTVACSAMETIAVLHKHLGKTMDPEAETTGSALLLKLAQTTSAFIHHHANSALDALVENCSPSRVESVLLNTGLNHGCAAVRGSVAQHLHQLTNIVGEDWMLGVGKFFAERFVTAVCKMSMDAAPEVRHYGQEMLQALALKKEFIMLWNRIIPVKDRPPLVKILTKKRQ